MPGLSTYSAGRIFDAIFNNTSFVIAAAYLQLHLGDPGADGTDNQATETTRQLVPGGAPAGGEITTDGVMSWPSISAPPGGETPTHFSLWDNSTPGAGNFLGSGTITAEQPYNNGDAVAIAAGDLDLSFLVAS